MAPAYTKEEYHDMMEGVSMEHLIDSDDPDRYPSDPETWDWRGI